MPRGQTGRFSNKPGEAGNGGDDFAAHVAGRSFFALEIENDARGPFWQPPGRRRDRKRDARSAFPSNPRCPQQIFAILDIRLGRDKFRTIEFQRLAAISAMKCASVAKMQRSPNRRQWN
jgi:hypothetical protein